MQFSIRQKITLTCALPILAVYVLILVGVTWRVRENTRASIEREMRQLTASSARELDDKLRNVAQVARTTAAVMESKPDWTDPQIYELLRRNVQGNPLVYGAAMAYEPFAFDLHKRIYCPYVCRSSGGVRQMDIATEAYDYTQPQWEWWNAPLKAAGPIWTAPYFDQGAGGILMCTFSIPFGKPGATGFRGVNTVDIDLTLLQHSVSSLPESQIDHLIIAADGRYIYHPDSSRILNRTLPEDAKRLGNNALEELSERLRQRSSGMMPIANWDQKNPVWAFYTPIESTGWNYVIRVDQHSALAPYRRFLFTITGALLGSMLLIIAGIWWVSGGLTRPFAELINAAQRATATGSTSASDITRARRRILGTSFIVLAGITLIVGVISNWLLYRAAMQQRETALDQILIYQTKLIGATDSTFEQVVKANFNGPSLGQTGRIIYGKMVEGQIVSAFEISGSQKTQIEDLQLTGPGGSKPMMLALRGQTGAMTARDVHGTAVLATYTYVTELGIGMVARIDLNEIRRPFIHAGMIGGGIAIVLIIAGGLLLMSMNAPLLRRLEDSEQRFRSLVQNIPGVTFRCLADEKRTLIYISERARELWGLGPAELVGEDHGGLNALVEQEDRQAFLSNIAGAIKEGHAWDVEYRIRNIDGTVRWVAETGMAISNDEGEVRWIDGSIFDISERKQAEVALREAQARAEAANRTKSEFLANMSHEIRTPMNAILGFSDLLRQSELSGRERSYLDAIISSGRSLLTLINDILDLSKVEAGKLEIQPEVFNLRTLLNEILMVFKQRAHEKGIGLELNIDPALPEWVYLDEVRLRQILFNLVGNALKFTHQGAVRLHARGVVDAEQTDRADLTLEVEDSGIGIPADQVDKIFESFQQVSGQSTRQYGGTGLGLAISRRLTEMMNGRISVTSELGKGSKFRIDLHAVTLTAPNTDAEGSGGADRIEDLKPATILYADDEPLNRSLMQGYFNGTAHQLILATNGQEAVEQVEADKPALVLMDMRMPVMNGEEATRLIKARFPDLPVIAVTASSLKEQQHLYEELCDFVLPKPLSRGDLAKTLKRYLPQVEKQNMDTPDPSASTASESAEAADWVASPELAAALREEMDGAWPRLRETPSMGEAEAFARRLACMAERFSTPSVGLYAQRLLNQIDEFNLEGLSKTLLTFPELMARLESQSERETQ